MERVFPRIQLKPLPTIGEGWKWFEALLRMKEGWVVVKKEFFGERLERCQGPVPCHGLQTLDKAATYTR